MIKKADSGFVKFFLMRKKSDSGNEETRLWRNDHYTGGHPVGTQKQHQKGSILKKIAFF